MRDQGLPTRQAWKNDGHAWECKYNPFSGVLCTCDRPGLKAVGRDWPADLNKAKPPYKDCPECSGFVTQEGRDIHQAIEHEPQNPDFCVRCGAPYAPDGSCSKRNDRERPCQGGRGENAAVRTLQKREGDK